MTGSDFGLLERITGHFRLMRPIQLIWFDIFIGFASYAVLTQHLPRVHFLLFILTSLLTDAGACTLNDIGDIASDRISTESSRKDRPLCKGTVSMRSAKIQAYSLFALGLLLALMLDIYVFIFTLSLVLLAHQYSLPPLKMNGRPFVSQLFWVLFAILYYLTISAYLVRYESIPYENILNGLYFLAVMVLFVGIAETLAKDLRDLENDRDSGKITTSVLLGNRAASAASFVFSVIGISLWAYSYFFIHETQFVVQAAVLLLVLTWEAICLYLCISIFRRYTKASARKLHIGYLLTLTAVLALTFIAGVT